MGVLEDFGEANKWVLWHYHGKLCIATDSYAACCIPTDNVGKVRWFKSLPTYEVGKTWDTYTEPMTKEQVRQLLMGKV